MIILVYAMKQLGVPIVRKRALNTKIQKVVTLCLALYILYDTVNGDIITKVDCTHTSKPMFVLIILATSIRVATTASLY